MFDVSFAGQGEEGATASATDIKVRVCVGGGDLHLFGRLGVRAVGRGFRVDARVMRGWGGVGRAARPAPLTSRCVLLRAAKVAVGALQGGLVPPNCLASSCRRRTAASRHATRAANKRLPFLFPFHSQVHNMTVRAKGKLLLENTSFTIAAGRRYGLVGPNGRGKSTLLRLLARRQLPVPENLDVLLVEQEVVGSELTALQV